MQRLDGSDTTKLGNKGKHYCFLMLNTGYTYPFRYKLYVL
jgi:hypothetical protein